MSDSISIPKKLITDLVDLWNKKSKRTYGSPNHSHSVPGLWDSDNGELANKPCAECALYDAARMIVSELEAGQ